MACSGPNMRDERGFTLVELLVAMAVLGVGLVAVASGFSYGLAGVEAGKQQTTATFLAEQHLEQIKGPGYASAGASSPSLSRPSRTKPNWQPSYFKRLQGAPRDRVPARRDQLQRRIPHV